jgi:hypothetical protein
MKKRVDLAHDQNFFSFEFAALDYTDSRKNQYAYKLEGLDENWIDSGNRRFANYTAVPPVTTFFVSRVRTTTVFGTKKASRSSSTSVRRGG